MISIVIPALNEEKYLPDCLKSLRDQDYTGTYEIVLCDNGSTDGTVMLPGNSMPVSSLARKRKVFLCQASWGGCGSSDIIAQADADTVYPRNWLSRIADRFEKHPEVVALTGRYCLYKISLVGAGRICHQERC